MTSSQIISPFDDEDDDEYREPLLLPRGGTKVIIMRHHHRPVIKTHKLFPCLVLAMNVLIEPLSFCFILSTEPSATFNGEVRQTMYFRAKIKIKSL